MCGIAAIKTFDGKQNALDLIVPAIVSIHQRGQKGTGFAFFDPENKDRINWYKSNALAFQAFAELVAKYPTRDVDMAIAQVRYATEGNNHSTRDLQPSVVDSPLGAQFGLVLNGNQPRYLEIRRQLERQGYSFTSNNEVEVINRYLVQKITAIDGWQTNVQAVLDAITAVLKMCHDGAISAVFMFQGNLFAFRDPYGFRPLHVGEGDGFFAVASETCSLDTLRIPRDKQMAVAPGTVVHIGPDNRLSVYEVVQSTQKRYCPFEMTYFSNVLSRLPSGETNGDQRFGVGGMLADTDIASGFFDRYSPDLIIAAPDSAIPYADGYAQRSGIRFHPTALVRNNYTGRSFITEGSDEDRMRLLRVKIQPNIPLLSGKSVVLVDDSIVRGTTVRFLLFLLVEAGVREIHLRIGSPKITHGCSWAILMEEYKLAMARYGSVAAFEKALRDAIIEHFGIEQYVLTLRYLSLENYHKVASPETHCLHCFTGESPL